MTVAPLRGARVALATAALSLLVAANPVQFRVGDALAAPAAQVPIKVVLFTPSPPDPLVARIEAELAAVGISVRRIPMPSDSQLDSVITREIASGASAAIRVIPRSRGTEVWAGDTTARVLRRRSIRADTSDATLSVIALRTVEFLRASLLDLKRRSADKSPAAARTGGDQTSGREPAASDRPSDRPGPGDKVAPAPPPGSSAAVAAAVAASAAAASAAATGPSAPSASAASTTPSTPPPASPSAPLASSASTAAPQTAGPEPRSNEPAAARVPVVVGSRPSEDAKPDPRVQSPLEPVADIDDRPSPTRAKRFAKTSGPPLRFDITAGPAILGSPGGVAPITAAATMGRGWITNRVGAELMAVFPLIASRLSKPEGSIDIRAALFGGGVTVRLTPPGPWTSDATAGLSAILFRAAGTGVGTVRGAANEGETESVWKLAGHLRLGGGVQVNRWLTVRADVIAGLAPNSRIAIGYAVTNTGGAIDVNRNWATWGPAFAAATIGVQANW